MYDSAVMINNKQDNRNISEYASYMEKDNIYYEMINSSPLGIAIYDNGHFTNINPSFCKMLNYTNEELLLLPNDDIKKLVHYKDRDKLFRSIKSVMEHEKSISSLFIRVLTSDGRIKWLDVSLNLLKFRQKKFLQVTSIDITERKKYEEQVLYSQRIETMGQLTAGVAHQLSTPLAVISSRLQILEDDLRKDGRYIYLPNLGKLQESSHKISLIITRLVTFLRQSHTTKISTNINCLLNEITGFINESARRKGIRIINNLTENLPPVKAFRNKLEQVFLNIIINAFDAMPKGGTTEISTNLVNHSIPCIEICFTDSGTGMDKNVKKRIFEPFFTTKSSDKASGLGMFISYSFIKEHNGNIVVKSRKAKGTQVKVLIPL